MHPEVRLTAIGPDDVRQRASHADGGKQTAHNADPAPPRLGGADPVKQGSSPAPGQQADDRGHVLRDPAAAAIGITVQERCHQAERERRQAQDEQVPALPAPQDHQARQAQQRRDHTQAIGPSKRISEQPARVDQHQPFQERQHHRWRKTVLPVILQKGVGQTRGAVQLIEPDQEITAGEAPEKEDVGQSVGRLGLPARLCQTCASKARLTPPATNTEG